MIFEQEGVPGSLARTIMSPIAGADPERPSSGELCIEADDGSSVTITVVLGDVEMSIDSNGDGMSDGTLSGSWDDLI